MDATRVKCLVCSREGLRANFEVIKLTEAERLVVQDPLDEYCYCKPCWRALSDPVMGPNILSGIADMHLSRAGVRDAKERSAKFRTALSSRALSQRNRQ